MLAWAFVEIAGGFFLLGWFGHMFHVWKKHHWQDSRLRRWLTQALSFCRSIRLSGK